MILQTKKKVNKGYVYLIKQDNFLKIGFTTNLEKRMKQYYTHNINFELLYYIEGTMSLEKEIHEKFKHLKYNTEWFYYSDEIIKYFYNNMNENNYVDKHTKVFIENIDLILNLNSSVANNIVYLLIKFVDSKTGVLFLTKEKRRFLMDKVEISQSQLSRSIKLLNNKMLILPLFKDTYMINPFVLWSGNEKDLTKAQEKFLALISQ